MSDEQSPTSRAKADWSEAVKRLESEGVRVVCTGCGNIKKVLPEHVEKRLSEVPTCCRRPGRKLIRFEDNES